MKRGKTSYAATFILAMAIATFIGKVYADDINWQDVPFIEHSEYQAVNPDGSSAYSGNFPIRLIGVVLNNNEDWLDPTASYDPGVHLWQMGGEAEIFIQAVNLDGTIWDPDPTSEFDDFGGTACWIGQNYGNHIMHQDPIWNYTDQEWYAELDRLGLYHPLSTLQEDQLVRAGDLVEIRVRCGLHYKGKMNVNERHDNDYDRDIDGENHDFEIVILQKNFGLPEPTSVHLSDLKDQEDNFIFDPLRITGGEHYQGILVRIEDVRLLEGITASWLAESEITVTDGVRTFNLVLGQRFDGTAIIDDPEQLFDVVGIFDQSDSSGLGGYRLLVMSPDSFIIVPEPASISVMLVVVGIYRKLAGRKRSI